MSEPRGGGVSLKFCVSRVFRGLNRRFKDEFFSRLHGEIFILIENPMGVLDRIVVAA